MNDLTYYDLPDSGSVHIETLIELDNYSEGPVIDRHGYLFFTDLAGKCIWRWKNGVAEVWAVGTRPNGQVILDNGHHLICDSLTGWVGQYNAEGILLATMGNEKIEDVDIRCPSDITVDKSGFYFTDSVRHTGVVFFVGFDGKKKVVAQNIDYPNGIAISPDGTHLLVAESYSNKILIIELESPGRMKGKARDFATLPFNQKNPKTGNLPDGIAFDPAGRLWVAHYGMQAVHVLSSSGDLLSTYDTGIPLSSNVCFDGPDAIITGGFDEPGPGRVSRLTVFGTKSIT